MRNTTKSFKTVLFCQCKLCSETFSLDATIKGNKIIKLEEHIRISRDGGFPTHKCGGKETARGKLTFILSM